MGKDYSGQKEHQAALALHGKKIGRGLNPQSSLWLRPWLDRHVHIAATKVREQVCVAIKQLSN